MDEFCVPDDVFYYLTNFLTPVDCMSLCSSGVSKRFEQFCCRKRVWKLSRCTDLTSNICQQFFTYHPISFNIQVLDLSHCFWLSESALLSSLSELNNLSELNVLDTKVSLSSLIRHHVIPRCRGLLKLAVNIVEPTWEDFNQKLNGASENYQECFKIITDLRLHFLDSSSPYIWLLLYTILGWCRDCEELQIEVFQSVLMRQDCPWEYYDASVAVMELGRNKYFEHMKWMISLKGFSVQSKLRDRCLTDFCRWLILEINPPALEKLWLPPIRTLKLSTFKAGPNLSCIYVGKLKTELCLSLCSQLTHLAGITVSCSMKLPRLKFIRADFADFLVMNEFCQQHPELEHLHFDADDSDGSRLEERITFQCQWALPRLRTLMFSSISPHPEALKLLLESCSNLEELHLGRLSNSSCIFLEHEPNQDIYRLIANQLHLKKLTLSRLEFTHGAFLEQVFQSCSLLQSLHIAAQFENDVSFHQDLCRFLPLAKNLRDFRIEREEMSSSILVELLSSIGSCPSLERLVIYQETWSAVSPALSATLPTSLVDLVSVRLPRLLAFCLIYPLEARVVEQVSNEFTKISQSRPSFWYYLGDSIPRGVSVPRVHLEEIIDPHEYIDSFRVFA